MPQTTDDETGASLLMSRMLAMAFRVQVVPPSVVDHTAASPV
jgi:hypothetical protein